MGVVRYDRSMSRFSGPVERRLFQAVLLVLGACERPAPQEPRQVVEAQPDAGMEMVAPADAAVVDPSEAAVVDPSEAAVVDPYALARDLCTTHKQTTRIDRAKATQGKTPHEGFDVRDMSEWDFEKKIANCTIVHERVPAKVTVIHTPHWCPQGGGKAPPPMEMKVDGEKVLYERVSIREGGAIAKKSRLEWTAVGMTNQPRHNCGRRFEGLELDESACSDEPGAQLAAMAELEAASVPAFERLARELATWGAPAELVARARAAMRDEVRHARVMTALAAKHGVAPRAIEVPALPCRSLEEIARENAIEGCVREAYGALVATYQAERAKAELRPAFRAIAVDERRHAGLAEDVHAWIVGQLDDARREEIVRARARAEGELRASVATSRACGELGLPSGADAIAMCDAYFA